MKKYIICGFLGHSPDLYPGTTYKSLAGTPIKITYGNDGQKRVNGLKFVKTDIITKNGVLHLIEKVCSPSILHCWKILTERSHFTKKVDDI